MGKKKRKAGRSLNARFSVSKTVKDRVMDEAQSFVYGSFAGRLYAGCLYWTAGVCLAAHANGLRLIPQAGTSSWRRLPEALDDGVVGTHFSYQWDGYDDERVQRALDAGMLPEMHVWAADPKRNEVVDATTRFLPRQCEQTAGLPWLMPEPPKYLWGGPSAIWQLDALYVPDADATKLALDLMDRELRKAGLL